MTVYSEDARRAALDDLAILDTSSEAEFDDIVTLAAHICGTPVALVSFLDGDRQWFKARVGLAACETPIGQSVCAYAVEQADLFVIEDLTLDPRTRDNPLVTDGPKMRFYAGCPLKAWNGTPIGTLCVIDNAPRPQGLTASQAGMLKALARQVDAQLRLRRLVNERTRDVTASGLENLLLQENDARARAAQKAGQIGAFEIDVGSDRMTVSSEFCGIFGLPPARTMPCSAIEAILFPADVDAASSLASRRDGSAPRDTRYRVRRADDRQLRWIGRRGDFIRDEAGTVVKMHGIVEDITDRVRREITQAALIEFGDKVSALDTTPEILDLASEILGRTLAVARAGYASFVKATELLQIQSVWLAPGTPHISRSHMVSGSDTSAARRPAGEIVAVDDVRAKEWSAHDFSGYDRIGVRAFIAAPVCDRGTIVGFLFVHQPTPRPWIKDEIDFVRAIGDRTFAGLARVNAEEDQRILNGELSHRLKNTLAMVQAIAHQTLREVPDQAPIQAFERRIFALGRAHDVLLQRNWTAANISTLIPSALKIVGRFDRYDLLGPDIEIGPRAALSLTILLHELATNAVKHGALSVDDGRIRLNWRVDPAEPDPRFTLSWTESGGLPATEPKRRGFGSKVIRMGLIGSGDAAVAYTPEGFRAEFKATVPQMQAP